MYGSVYEIKLSAVTYFLLLITLNSVFIFRVILNYYYYFFPHSSTFKDNTFSLKCEVFSFAVHVFLLCLN